MPYTAPTTRATFDMITPSIWNADLVNNIAFLANPPSCRVFHNAAQSIANATQTALAFNSEREDTDTMHDTVTNNSRITIKTAGRYLVTASVEWAAVNVTGRRQVGIRLNGVTFIAIQAVPAMNDNQPLVVATAYKFALNDYVEAVVYQASTGALNIVNTGNYTPEFTATWIGLG